MKNARDNDFKNVEIRVNADISHACTVKVCLRIWVNMGVRAQISPGRLLSLVRISKCQWNVREARRPSRPGSRARLSLKGPGSSGGLDDIWCNLSLVFDHFCTKLMTNISEIILVLRDEWWVDHFWDTLPVCHSVRKVHFLQALDNEHHPQKRIYKIAK